MNFLQEYCTKQLPVYLAHIWAIDMSQQAPYNRLYEFLQTLKSAKYVQYAIETGPNEQKTLILNIPNTSILLLTGDPEGAFPGESIHNIFGIPNHIHPALMGQGILQYRIASQHFSDMDFSIRVFNRTQVFNKDQEDFRKALDAFMNPRCT